MAPIDPVEPPPPQFGEVRQFEDAYHRHHRIKMIALAILFILGSTVTGAILGGGVGALFGLGISIGVIGARYGGIHLFHLIFPHKHNIKLDWDKNIPHPGPTLGKYVYSDMLIENDGEKSYNMKLAMLRSAQKSILLSPCYAGGEYWQETLDIIEERMKSCVDLKVSLLIANCLMTDEDRERIKQFQQSYPDQFNVVITEFQFGIYPYLHMAENHTKILVVDDKYFSTGGSPINERGACLKNKKKNGKDNLVGALFNELMPKKFRDADGFGKGEVAKTMRDQFFRLYALWNYRTTGKREWLHYEAGETDSVCREFEDHPNRCPGVKTKVLVSGPEHRGHNPIIHEMMGIIDGAKKGANISGLYFTPDKEFKDLLTRKKKERVEVHGYFGNDQIGLGQKLTYKINRFGLEFLAKVHLYSDPTFYYHKKVGTVDGKKGWIGSCNQGGKSLRCDHELTLFFDSKRIVDQIDQGFREDREKAKPMERNAYHYFAKAIGNVMQVLIGQVAF
jgi:hypothetical protein